MDDEDVGAPKEKPDEDGAEDPKEKGLADPAAGCAEDDPKENNGFDAPDSPVAAGVLPNENEEVDLPASSAFDGDAPKENEGADDDAPSFDGEPEAPKLNEGEDVDDAPKLNPLDDGTLGDPFAPPNDSWGVVPSGPNLPSLAGGSVDEEVNFLLSGVVAASGPDGAKEKSPPDAGFELKENFGASSFFSSFLSSFISSSSAASTSSTILFTASDDDFFGVAAGAEAAGADA